MKLVIQRVKSAKVTVADKVVGEIGRGLFILVGVGKEDSVEKAHVLSQKIVKMRLMADENGKMNLPVSDVNGSMLVVSQFTLYADTSGGNRPSFVDAALSETACIVYEEFVTKLKELGMKVETGKFGEYMKTDCELDGPVTIVLELEAR